jgi:hypothetical protein
MVVATFLRGQITFSVPQLLQRFQRDKPLLYGKRGTLGLNAVYWLTNASTPLVNSPATNFLGLFRECGEGDTEAGD